MRVRLDSNTGQSYSSRELWKTRISSDLKFICCSIVLQFLSVGLQNISAVILNKSLSYMMCGKYMEWILQFCKVLILLLHRNSEILIDHYTNTNCSDTGWSKLWILIEARDFFYSLQHPDQLWSQPILSFHAYCGSFQVVKNEWSYTSTPPICLHGVDKESLTFFTTVIWSDYLTC